MDQEAAPPLLVAFSGGGDSLALLHALVEARGAAGLLAVTIDHGVRAGSAAEAARACETARALGVEGIVVRLTAPGAGQADWRRARYAALCETARARGIEAIALGHTADDQAETVLMRAAAGSGLAGLAGMAAASAAPIWPEGRGIAIIRPLLGARRDELRKQLEARGAAWIDDPANDNPDFTRVRARQALGALAAGGFDVLRLNRLAARLRLAVAAQEAAAAAWIAAHACFEGPEIGFDAPPPLRALSALLCAAAGAERPAPDEKVAALRRRLGAPAFQGATLGGARVRKGRRGWRLGRDPGAVLGRGRAPGAASMPVAAGEEIVWDGRLLVKAAAALTIHPGVGAPRIAAGAQAAVLEALAEAGALQYRWLLSDRVNHLLNVTERSRPGEGFVLVCRSVQG